MSFSGVPAFSMEAEATRRIDLRRHKALATGLLILAGLIYLACQWYDTAINPGTVWVGFVRAAAEAGMVGGLADWFAVTALFRYPLGLKIPHTAIIRRKKDQVGRSLSEFIGDNFLNAALITEKVAALQLPLQLARWLSVEKNARTVSVKISEFLVKAISALDPGDAESVIKNSLIDRLAEPQWAPPLGRVLSQLHHEGRSEPLVDQLVAWLHRKALGSEALIARLLDERAPSWAPRFVNELVGDLVAEKVYRELITWTGAVNADKDHEARQGIRDFIERFASDLQSDPTLIAKVEELKQQFLSSTPIHNAPQLMWQHTREGIITACSNPDSLLRQKLEELAQTWGQRLATDEALRDSVERRFESIAEFFADNYATEVTGIISETIERWDADEASEKIELMVGKDLQYIRLNGTLVGALAGLAIYTVSYLLF
ncbi:DUF445 family protein [Corynebacterium sp. ES2794-CONJ1]|uniref:DUF445 domain-containing protein n=1 Tax=unclassified Corynebacterium TaxID=2624378 RepID=UPI00216AB8C3|nr:MULTISPECIES: DUF445 family protein [unclassified Corynebacterium]MCS4531656.1 DUF445 family protein [Corynebacterium sp. ES2730-CONJ]MCU9519052.1 DUF445 family protein [Corynebacterium sp. ES2794-CONJ1]